MDRSRFSTDAGSRIGAIWAAGATGACRGVGEQKRDLVFCQRRRLVPLRRMRRVIFLRWLLSMQLRRAARLRRAALQAALRRETFPLNLSLSTMHTSVSLCGGELPP